MRGKDEYCFKCRFAEPDIDEKGERIKGCIWCKAKQISLELDDYCNWFEPKE